LRLSERVQKMKGFGNKLMPHSWLAALPLVAVLAVFAFSSVAQGAAVLSTSPSNGATNTPTSTHGNNNVVTGTAVIANFSEPMEPATIDSALPGKLLTFTLKDSDGNTIEGTVAMNATNTVATFTPTVSALKTNEKYVAAITTAAHSAGGIAIPNSVEWSFTTGERPLTGQGPVGLGTAGTFAILTKTGITDVYASSVTGDVGTSPITGAALLLKCDEVSGKMYTVNAAGPLPCSIKDPTLLTAAIGDMGFAYTDAAGRSIPDFTELGAGEIGGLTLVPGLYKWGSGVSISTDVTLSGGPNDVWIFQIASALKQASATRITLAGGAQAKNIFWQAGGVVAIGTTAHFEGVLLGKTLIAVKTGASVNGRLMAQTAVTLEQNAVTQPAP
jgi:hypothetical protein